MAQCFELTSQGCSCSDKLNCTCIKVGQTLNLNSFAVVPEIPDTEISYQLFVNDELYWEGDSIQNHSLEFENQGVYIIKLAATICSTTEEQICNTCVYKKNIVVGPVVSLSRISCNVYQVIDYEDYNTNPYNFDLTLYDINGNELKSATSDSTKDKVFSVPADGVYKLRYRIIENNAVTFTYNFLIFEICSLLKCYDDILRAQICSVDPNCDPATKAAVREGKDKLTAFVAMFAKFLQVFGVQYGISYGYFYFDPQYLTVYKEQQFLITAMSKICGYCKTSIFVNSGCSSCNK